MSESSTRVRLMLQGYEQQLLAARRLVHFRAKMRTSAGKSPDDPDPTKERSKRMEQVAKVVYDDLIYTGNFNPIIEEIRAELSKIMGVSLQFIYPPGKRLCIVKSGEHGQEALTLEEQRMVRTMLFRVTREKINDTMLREQVVYKESEPDEYKENTKENDQVVEPIPL